MEVDRFLPPLMHGMLGIGNKMLHGVFKYADELDGIETLPPSLINARRNYYEALAELIDAKQALEVWNQLDGKILVNLRLARLAAIQYIQQNKGDWSKEEKEEAEEEKKAMTKEINQLAKEKKELENAVAEKSVPVNEAKAALKLEEDAFPKKDRWVRAELEHTFLRPYGIERAAHHGGDVTGPGIRRLMENGKEIFDKIAVFLDGIAKENRLSKEVREQIQMRMELFGTCLQQFDGFFSRVRKRTSEIEDLPKLVEEARAYLTAGIASWKKLGFSVTPKVHLLEDHVLVFMLKYGGLGDYDEEFVERSHQTGVRGMVRNKFSARDQVRKYINLSRWEHAGANPLVAKVKEEVAEKRKSTKRKPAKVSKKAAKRGKKEEGRKRSLGEAGLYENADILSVEELNLKQVREEQEEEDSEDEEGEDNN